MDNKKVRRNPSPMSLDTLIYEIESLEEDGIISFDEFKQIDFYDIKGHYFPMVNIKTIHKALKKIQDQKSGKIGLSSLTTIISETERDGKLITKKRIDTF
ncbi:hypothetical protein SHK09_10555 [Polaribacter sp. PL03]|uniref:hypothetical protein n=1 Tax=Polaribacter sp. PL03 TaxID=3088353 RepID=UPI0029D3811C|nr:hypothetical protein [Polaribacter sp. PL03]MDX6747233.1 hypothetical protein [Polaribacter sp. PL03]